MLAGGRGSGLKQLCPLISLCRQSWRLMQTEAEFLELPAPYGVASRRRSMLMPRGSRPTGGMKGRFMRHSLMQKKRRRGRTSTKTSVEDEIAHLRGLDLGRRQRLPTSPSKNAATT